MAIITLPPAWPVASFSLRCPPVQRGASGPSVEPEQVVDLLKDRWMCSLTLTPTRFAKAYAIEAFIGRLRGSTNQVALWHMAHPSIAGTLGGAKVLAAAAPQFAASLSITGTGTLLAGDMLSVATPTGGTLLFQCADACAAVGGVLTVPVNQRVRVALAAGAAVTTLRPTALFGMLSTSYSTFEPGRVLPVSFEFGEYIPP